MNNVTNPPTLNQLPSRGVLGFVIVLITLLIALMPQWQQIDDLYNDIFRRHIAENSKPTEQILILEIDDKSLTDMEQRLGRWPWPRSNYGFLIEYLTAAGAKAIVFDILFVERDMYRPEDDAYFNESLENTDNVFFAATLLNQSSPVESINFDLLPDSFYAKVPVKASATTQEQDSTAHAKLALPWVINDPAKWNIGLINFLAEWDGVSRRYPKITEVEGWKIHSLPSHVVGRVQSKNNEVNERNIGHKKVNETQDEFYLKFKGIESVPFLSMAYSDAWFSLEQESNLALFKDKIIIIGATATGLNDLRATPISKRYPGTSILATAMDNLLLGESLKLVNHRVGLLILFVLSGLVVLINFRSKDYRSQLIVSIAFVLICGAGLLLSSFYLSRVDYLMPAVSIMGPLLIMTTGILFYQGMREYLSKRHALKTFSRFMDPKVVSQLMADQNWQSSIANKSSEVSVLFSDIRGFTSLSEKRSAEQIMAILNNYFDSQVEAIFEWRGTLDKFIGDAIMAFWGAPITDPNHAENAVEAALSMVENLKKFRENLPEELQGFDVGIGIHSGDAVVGMLGSAKRFDYTAIGDTVNLASRIEGKTKGVARILVSEATKVLCENKFDFVYKGQFAVKGREEEVKLYEPHRRVS